MKDITTTEAIGTAYEAGREFGYKAGRRDALMEVERARLSERAAAVEEAKRVIIADLLRLLNGLEGPTGMDYGEDYDDFSDLWDDDF